MLRFFNDYIVRLLCVNFVSESCLLSSDKKEGNTACRFQVLDVENNNNCSAGLNLSNSMPSIYINILPP